MSKRLRSLRKPLASLMILLLLVAGCGLLLDTKAPIDYYRVIDDHTLMVGAGTGPSLWARVTLVTETNTVVVGVSSIRAPLPSTNDQITELTVSLRAPLGDRTVIDGSSGLTVPRR